MRAFGYKRHGSIEQLQELDLPEPTLSRRSVIVDVDSVGLNPLDYRIRRGELGPLAFASSARLSCSDFSGVVVAVGQGVDQIRIGDAVYGMTFQPLGGTSAEKIRVHASVVAPKPKNLSHSHAAVVPLAALTAYQAFAYLAKLQTGQRVLINGASGGVGTFAVQIARAMGAEVTAVTSYRNTGWMASLGAESVVDYTEQDCCCLDARFDVFFDCYGNRRFTDARNVLSKNGMYITTIPAPRTFSWGVLNGFRKQKSRVVVVRKSKTDLIEITRLIESGAVRPIVQMVYPSHGYRDAYAALESKRVRGKLAVKMSRDIGPEPA
ncbi:MAG: NAD(P)-dependent alcohol dehydrogenase [Myxococcota bacterium]|nr:NAD(P)-dependent alcohol dehydrogenase [Myxococcota bacterium]